MNIKLVTLTLQCRKSREVIHFSSQITYIHGQISAGKSSIMRLIDFCFGGTLEKTPAISQELVSVELTVNIGRHQVLLEREAESANTIQVTWQDEQRNTSSVLAPLKLKSAEQAKPIWSEDIYNFSDLVFYLADITPIKVRKSKQSDDSPLIRLSFRDIMWYCYLDQDNLDSSFYRLKDPFRGLKSRDAMRFFTGYYTERMNELEIELDRVTEDRHTKIEAAKQIRKFLHDFGYGLETEIYAQIESINAQLEVLKEQQRAYREEHSQSTHFTDELRQQLRQLSEQLGSEVGSLEDLNERISEQTTLQAELLTAKFKLAKSESATSILAGVEFEKCPSCGTDLDTASEIQTDECNLCGNLLGAETEDALPQTELMRRDLNSRVEDLEESITRHRNALTQQVKRVEQLRNNKAELDARLSQELTDYDSAYLAGAREIDRKIATLEERSSNLRQVLEMYKAVGKFEQEAEQLKDRQIELRELIDSEKMKLGEAEENVVSIEKRYKTGLLSVGVPGVSPNDQVEINRRTWLPWIFPEEGDGYTFYNAGSGGKKTLLNVCYALAVHQVTEISGLPMPTLLMIDTPMKNIGEDVNENIFHAFYTYLYNTAAETLQNTQFIIVDKEYFEPPQDFKGQVEAKFMSPTEPLISYYRGA